MAGENGGGRATKLTPHARETFLSELRLVPNVARAARIAGFSREAAYDWRKADPEFAADWEAALTEAIGELEAEARRRGAEGYLRDVYYQGVVVGQERCFSDTLLVKMLEAHHSPYRQKHEITGANGEPLEIRWKGEPVGS